MKKFLAVLLVLVSLFGFASAELYPAVGFVFDLDEENNLVVFEDFTNNLWIIEGIEDWDYGDIGALLMDDLGTESIEDDVVVSALYAGYVTPEN